MANPWFIDSALFMNLHHLPGRHWGLAAVMLTAAVFIFEALWIPTKAGLAQHLLERSWLRTLAGEPNAKPWPWADTRAVAILEVPRLGQRVVVLEGSSGRNLAFGPTQLNPGRLEESSDRILSGHRDTHFRFLKELHKGDLLRLYTTKGVRDYRVSWLETVDSRQQHMVIDDRIERLTLLTCYPFDAPTAGGPLRWVVTALPEPIPVIPALSRNPFLIPPEKSKMDPGARPG
jgi:sortase A